ncbi:hypothetical protein NUW58_g5285 [Xylaria curta]|uniref:Uncharacterized protein n=1 Tax=Xylaria curta TaxID=42375 RepID=A0ACC1P2A0_9PEZI|nr:hypothetical protein NUW58_g5285 [Xylaria curta]
MATPGLMFVESRVRDDQRISDAQYNHFYNTEHLPDVLASGQTKLALRYTKLDSNGETATYPYIALYPVDDARTIGSAETLKLAEDTKKSKVLECDDIANLIHFNLRPYEKIQTYEDVGRNDGNGKERCPFLSCVAIEPAEGQDEELDSWYREEQLDFLGRCEGFRRCTRYKRVDSVSPRFLALIEWNCVREVLFAEQSVRVPKTEWDKKILNEAKVYTHDLFVLIEAQGDTHIKL